MSKPANLDWLTARPHRAPCGLRNVGTGIVENTLGACAAAIEAGYAIECDLQISRDGEAMLFHDDTLDRVTEARGPVNARTLAELKQIRFKHSAEQIPTLSELVSLVDGRVPLVIELKPQWDGDQTLARRTAEVMAGYRGAYCLMSFDPGVIKAIRMLAPDTVRGMISDTAQPIPITTSCHPRSGRSCARLGSAHPASLPVARPYRSSLGADHSVAATGNAGHHLDHPLQRGSKTGAAPLRPDHLRGIRTPEC